MSLGSTMAEHRNKICPVATAVLLAISAVPIVVASIAHTTLRPSQIDPMPLPVDMLAAACQAGNPYFAVSVMFPSNDAGFSAYNESISAIHDTEPDDPKSNYRERLLLSLHGNVGSVYGLAYDWRRNQLYSGAYHTIQKTFGPGGVGAVYRTDLDTGQTSLWARLPAGKDPHSSISRLYDYQSAPWVGKVALGDIDVDSDVSTLFAVNLYDRRIYALSVPDGAIIGSFPYGAASEQWSADARPLGLGYHDGWLYHGVVDSQETRRSGPPVGYVYRSRVDGTEMTLVSTVRFDYSHRPSWTWWHNVLDPLAAAQPSISDIDFRGNGDLILGIRNRVVDTHEALVGGGDILAAKRDGSGDRFVVEDPFHYRDSLPASAGSERGDGIIGGIASYRARDSVVVTGLSFWGGSDGYIADAGLWYNNESGIVDGPMTGVEWLISDFSGEGDIELLCPPDAPTVTPTSTSTPTSTMIDTPTSSPTSSLTPTPKSTLTPTATITTLPPRHEIYLPFCGRTCSQQRKPADVVLVIDRSSSMLRPVGMTGRSKNESAIDAAQQFLALLDLSTSGRGPRDRVALVGFHDTAWTELPYSGDRSALASALAHLKDKTAEGTRLDLAFSEAGTALSSARPSAEVRKVVVLLTDGLPNRVPFPPGSSQEAVVLASARAVKDAGATVYTIGFGLPEDIDSDLLRQAATIATMYYEVPDPTALASIYREIAGQITVCR